jgi:hypothetical protein
MLELTSHMVTTLVLFDVIYTSWTWTFLRELPDGRKTSGFLSLLQRWMYEVSVCLTRSSYS